MSTPKPSVKKYFRNTKTGQLCSLSGSPLAVDAELADWRRKKIVSVRIPERDWPKRPYYIGIGAGYNPLVTRNGRSAIRKGLPESGLNCSKIIIEN